MKIKTQKCLVSNYRLTCYCEYFRYYVLLLLQNHHYRYHNAPIIIVTMNYVILNINNVI